MATTLTRPVEARATPLPRRVRVIEVGPRDGFQIERTFIPTETKIEIVNALIDAGIDELEVTSFVSPRAVPQLADAAEVMAGIDRSKGARLTVLVPNAKGAERAVAAKVDEMHVFVSASESHNRKNVNRSIAASLEGFKEVAAIARSAGIPLSGGMATAFGCPFEGEVPVENVLRIAAAYAELGIAHTSLGDTTGMATPPLVRSRLQALRKELPELEVGLHLHNTRGIGLVNAYVGLEEGVTRFDASIAGLGGCPFAAGATGNICTEDLIYMLDEMGIASGVDLGRLIQVARRVEQVIGRELPGQVMKAGPRLALSDPSAVATACG